MENYSFSLTENAIKFLKDKDFAYLRIGVKGGGCNGYSYFMKYDTSFTENDLLFNDNNINIIIDNKSIRLLNGAKLDFKSSLTKSALVIINPNEKSTCGCGKSFSV
jgi:iron-sulfur cluster assembly protein